MACSVAGHIHIQVNEYPIVATDLGILHAMRLRAPGKVFLAAPTAGHSATCKSCAFCPWMAMNGLAGVAHALEHGAGEIQLNRQLAEQAYRPIARMLDFAASHTTRVASSGDFEQDTALFCQVGAA